MTRIKTIAKQRFWSRHRKLLRLSLLCAMLVLAHGLPSSNSIDSKNVPIQIELLDPGPSSACTSSFNAQYKDCSTNLYYVRLNGFDVAPMFPFTSETTLQLYRDPTLNQQLHNRTDYNIFVIDKDGVDQRVDGYDEHDHRLPANSKISFFRGQVVSSPLSPSLPTANIPNSQILAIGYIDSKSGLISLQAFIQHHNTLLYLHPGNIAEDANLHFVSNENGSIGENFFELYQRQFAQQSRLNKRQTNDKVTQSCPMMIMADFSLFQLMNESRAKTVLFIHFVFTFGNDIFKNTKFTRNGVLPSDSIDGIENSDHFQDFGHTLCKIVIEEHMAQHPTEQLYNEERNYWPQHHLEKKLSELSGRENYCLAYLFTNLRIEGSKYPDMNGFAMEGGIFSSNKDVPNVGVVSFAKCKDPWNLYCVLNFPHELGHSWGAPHDADTEECMPSNQNGSFLISFPFIDQIGPNNFQLSPCSIRSIYVKIEDLLLYDSRIFTSYCAKCGNGRMEESEECDETSFAEGENSRNAGDCCTRSCKLTAGAQCSPFNHDCCDNECKVKSSTDVCRPSDPQYCLTESRCDGLGLSCPSPAKMPDGTTCTNGGTCQSGYCNSTCPANHVDCQCHDACRICCQEVQLRGNVTVRGECRATDINMPDGSACLYNETSRGQCMEGWCTAIKSDTLPDGIVPDSHSDDSLDSHSWSIIELIAVLAILLLLLTAILFIRFAWNWSHSDTFDIQHNRNHNERQPLHNGQEYHEAGHNDV